jgi:hypothetical protein
MNTIALRAMLWGGILTAPVLLPAATAEPAPPASDKTPQAQAALATIPVDSSAFVFSPGNWTGDDGRAGKVFRQTWNPYSYFRIAWESANPDPQAKLLLDTSSFTKKFNPPQLAYQIDGAWKSGIACASEIVITDLAKFKRHDLTVCMY